MYSRQLGLGEKLTPTGKNPTRNSKTEFQNFPVAKTRTSYKPLTLQIPDASEKDKFMLTGHFYINVVTHDLIDFARISQYN